ncbi:3-carboxy-cis,cis-muconate cycloisomerase [Actinocorallia populi]|uniref:3-carboxy-cis,cis-muconate cycloisomerase n=1 Tax=Actinocorallia populi TaxID=2079200 RepID=UPI000D094221|nr:3-carboxy-cis,cis-muconate cycloisomerase [Actinocorallia populi]
MSSPDAADGADLGLLSPVRAGSAVAQATGDLAFLQAMLDAEAALTRAQARLGLAPAEAAQAVSRAASAGRLDPRGLAERARAGGNPVIPLVADLTAAVGPEHGPYVHRGATSQDILDTALMLVARRAVAVMAGDLDRTAAALARLAAEHRTTPMPGRTLTQHAVPTTFGLKAAGWRSLVLDGRDRLAALVLPAQLGGAAGTLAAFAEFAGPARTGPDGVPATRLVEAFAAETGLAAPVLPWHVLRTPVADLGAALAVATGALGKLAADVLVLSRTEIGEVAEGTGGGSSAMPHKSNPVRATLIASAARQVPALASILFGAMTAEDERPAGAWHAEWQPLREALRLAGGAAEAAAELAAGLVVRPERMRANLDLTHGLIVSERAGIRLADRLGRARSREVLDEASRRTAATGAPLAASLEALDAGGIDTDPAAYLGAAAALVDAALERESTS